MSVTRCTCDVPHEEDAMEYAFGPSPEQELADDYERNDHA